MGSTLPPRWSNKGVEYGVHLKSARTARAAAKEGVVETLGWKGCSELENNQLAMMEEPACINDL